MRFTNDRYRMPGHRDRNCKKTDPDSLSHYQNVVSGVKQMKAYSQQRDRVTNEQAIIVKVTGGAVTPTVTGAGIFPDNAQVF